MKRWTTSEMIKLRRCYPIMSEPELEKAFPRHSINSIIGMARRKGIRKRRDWAAIARKHVPVIFGARGVE
jgi:hypothetical protein